MSALSFRANVASVSGLHAQECSVRATRSPLQVEARVALRFSRGGRIHRPFYRLVAIDSNKPRDSRPIQYLGWYDPISKQTQLKAPEIKKWIGQGAKPSETVTLLLKRTMIITE